MDFSLSKHTDTEQRYAVNAVGHRGLQHRTINSAAGLRTLQRRFDRVMIGKSKGHTVFPLQNCRARGFSIHPWASAAGANVVDARSAKNTALVASKTAIACELRSRYVSNSKSVTPKSCEVACKRADLCTCACTDVTRKYAVNCG